MRHALGGGKRVRPVLCLATGEALGARVEDLLPAAAAVELVHSFSLVHDDLPALDDDGERRGRAVRLGAVRRGVGDPRRRRAARRGDAARARLSVGRRRARARRRDARDDRRPAARSRRRRASSPSCTALKTGALFRASVMCALWAAGVPVDEHPPWRAFAADARAALPDRRRHPRRRRLRRRGR